MHTIESRGTPELLNIRGSNGCVVQSAGVLPCVSTAGGKFRKKQLRTNERLSVADFFFQHQPCLTLSSTRMPPRYILAPIRGTKSKKIHIPIPHAFTQYIHEIHISRGLWKRFQHTAISRFLHTFLLRLPSHPPSPCILLKLIKGLFTHVWVMGGRSARKEYLRPNVGQSGVFGGVFFLGGGGPTTSVQQVSSRMAGTLRRRLVVLIFLTHFRAGWRVA